MLLWEELVELTLSERHCLESEALDLVPQESPSVVNKTSLQDSKG
jgi:hypothetical protein